MRSIFTIYEIKKASRCIFLMFVAYAAVSLFAPAAYASGFGEEIYNIGRIIQVLAFSLGAVGIAWSGIEYAISSGSKADKAKSRIIYIFFATVAVMLLPTVIQVGKAIFEAGAWSPSK